jgi:O-antigen ligase
MKREYGKSLSMFCDGTIVVFLGILFAFGPDTPAVFIPAELLFVSVFAVRFFVLRSRFTGFAAWSFLFVLLSFCSIFHASSRELAMVRFISIIQVLVLSNLVIPYLRESHRNYLFFLESCVFGVFVLCVRLIVTASVPELFSSRLGLTVGMNADCLGFVFSIAGLVSLYLVWDTKNWFYLLPMVLYSLFGMLSGFLEVVAILAGIGMLLLIALSEKKPFWALGAFLVLSLVALVLFASTLGRGLLYRILGSRNDFFFAFSGRCGTEGNVAARMEMIENGLSMFRQKPLFGWGQGTFADIAGYGSSAYDNYVELLVSLGLVGTIAYCSLHLGLFARGFGAYLKRHARTETILSLSLLLVMSVGYLGQTMLFSEFPTFVLAVCYVGIARNDSRTGKTPGQLLEKGLQWIREPRLFVLHLLKWKGARILSDKAFVSMKYRMSLGKKLDLENPRTYNEKLQWLKLYDRKKTYSSLVDKYEVRDYIARSIGVEYLIPLVGVYERVEDIDIDSLPDSFVLKATHTSGDILVCKDKSTFDREAAKREMRTWLGINYYWYDREWPYKDVKPRIVCEKYMEDESGYELKDYKIFTFGGEPRMIEVDFDRYRDHKRNLYDPDWNYIPVTSYYPTHPEIEIPKPVCLEQMLSLSRVLAKGFLHLRVDFYVVEDRIYFGELTFYHGSGFKGMDPESFEEVMGSWLKLPHMKG